MNKKNILDKVVNVSLTINQCYGILALINKQRTKSENIHFGKTDEMGNFLMQCSAYKLDQKFRNLIVIEEDKAGGIK